jgi:hypothetical protein
MKKIILALLVFFSILSVAHADHEGWVEVVSKTIGTDANDYRDILIHNPDVYSEVRLEMPTGGRIDHFDIISTFLWGTSVPELQGDYAKGSSKEAFFGATKIRFVRIYARALHPMQPVQVKVWMR